MLADESEAARRTLLLRGRFRARRRPALTTEQSDGWGRTLRSVFFRSPALAGMVGRLILLRADVLPWLAPP
jgi:hypothetical protein